MERDRFTPFQQDFRPSFSSVDADLDSPPAFEPPTPIIDTDVQPTQISNPTLHYDAHTTAATDKQLNPLPILPKPDKQQTDESNQAELTSAVQVYPVPEIDTPKSQNRDRQSVNSLNKIRAPYDAYAKYLSKMLRRLRSPSPTEVNSSDNVEVTAESPQTITYPTPLGTLSFQELHERTRKYAAFVLHHTHQVHPGDIDDALQAGYAHLWERLQQEPDLLKEKEIAWIGKGIVYTGLHAIRGDWKYQKHTQAEEGRSSTDMRGTQSRESRQADMRTDIHQAIVAVANQILKDEKGKRADHDLWALYGLTMLQVSSSELSRLFQVREQSMHTAYKRVREKLQAALPDYAPRGATKPFQPRGPKALPRQDMAAIRKANESVSDETYAAVRTRIAVMNADTRRQDEIALEGIRQGIPISTQARTYGLPQYQMQRTYARVHLLIAAEHDPTVRVRRPEHRVKSVFTLTPESAAAVEALAQELLAQPKSYERLVALHAHIANLAVSTTAKHFNIPTSTLRYYMKQIASRLMTPTQPVRGDRVSTITPITVFESQDVFDAHESAAD